MPVSDRQKPRLLSIILAAILCMSLLTGCGGRIYLTTGFEEDHLFQINGTYAGADELRVYMLDQVKTCQLVMGSDALIGGSDEEMTKELRQMIRDKSLNQVTRVRTVNLMAIEDNIMLTNAENEKASEAAKEYYDGLTPFEKEYLDTDLDALTAMFRRYALAVKTHSSIGAAFVEQYDAFVEGIDLDLNVGVWNSCEPYTIDDQGNAANTFRNAYIRAFGK